MAVQMQKALLLLELHKSAEFLQTALPITDYFLSQQFVLPLLLFFDLTELQLLQTQRKLKKRKRKSVVPQASETVRETPEQAEPSATSEETIFMFGPTTGKHGMHMLASAKHHVFSSGTGTAIQAAFDCYILAILCQRRPSSCS